jgi:uncharacterized protein (TIGR02145 family)
MKKANWISPTIFLTTLVLIACHKDKTSSDIEYKVTHWPVVKTLEAKIVTPTTATLKGAVNGYGLPTRVIFEYGTSESYGNSVIAIQSPVKGDSLTHVSADISGLVPSVEYHFRLKAENSLWTNFYGCDETLMYGVLDIDGNNYKTVQIGTQTWMAENLRTTRYADGTTIPLVTPHDNWGSLTDTSKAYCWSGWGFGGDSANLDHVYGPYYTWQAAMNGADSSSLIPSGVQGVCPTGWHLPSKGEWEILINYVGTDSGSYRLKETGTLHWEFNEGANNETGFTALPDGVIEDDGQHYGGHVWGSWWSSYSIFAIQSHHSEPSVFPGIFRIEYSRIYFIYWYKKGGVSVRCLKN